MHLGSFGLFKLIWVFLRPFNLDSFQPIKFILEEITLIYILLIRCKLCAVAVISYVPLFVLWLSYGYIFLSTVIRFCDNVRHLGRKPLNLKMPVALVSRILESWYLSLLRSNCLPFYIAVLLQIMVLVCVQFRCPCTLLTSYLLLGLVNHVVCLPCNSCCAEYEIYYHKGKMLVDCWISNLLPQGQDVGRLLNIKFTTASKMLVYCMFSQPYRSLIESQNCCLDNSNSNSVIGSVLNQTETPVGVDISTRRFSLSFISVVNLSVTFLDFSSIDFFISVLSFLDYLRLYRSVNLML